MSNQPWTPAATREGSRRSHWAATACLWGGLVGFAQAIAVVALPTSTSEERYSFPFTEGGYVAAQLSFFLQHLPLIAGLALLLSRPLVRSSRTGKVGVAAGFGGMVLLALMELVAISAAAEATDSSRAELVNALYGVPTMLTGVGLLIGGIALLRSKEASHDTAPWVPLVVTLLGAWVFVPLLPAIMGPHVLGRLAIGGWMLLFAALGLGLAHPRTARVGRGEAPSPMQHA